ncbi:hypothetical protein [Lewinella cohaerens]|nr:hypothetical protein [Lewinella cohaerens]
MRSRSVLHIPIYLTATVWNEVDKILPNYDKQMTWLKLNRMGMDL